MIAVKGGHVKHCVHVFNVTTLHCNNRRTLSRCTYFQSSVKVSRRSAEGARRYHAAKCHQH